MQRGNKIAKPTVNINHRIRATELRVIDFDGSQAGVLTKQEALDLARERGLDLVEISPNASPPVAKVIDWGKYNYQKTKKIQKNKKNQKATALKQIRFGLKIGDNDLDIKMKKVRKFLEQGHKVRISAFFKGREMAHQDIGRQVLQKALDSIEDCAVTESNPVMAGRYLSVTVRSNNAKN